MPGQQDIPSAPAIPPASDLSSEISSSLSAVWADYVGARPAESAIEVEGKVVRWTLPGGTSQFKEGMAREDEEGAAASQAPRTLYGYKRRTAAAVAKTTRRRVMAVISKHDAKTGIATETFILERRATRY